MGDYSWSSLLVTRKPGRLQLDFTSPAWRGDRNELRDNSPPSLAFSSSSSSYAFSPHPLPEPLHSLRHLTATQLTRHFELTLSFISNSLTIKSRTIAGRWVSNSVGANNAISPRAVSVVSRSGQS